MSAVRDRDYSQLLIDGYCRDIDEVLCQIIPTSINGLCFEYYHIEIDANSKVLTVNEKIMLAKAFETNKNIGFKWKLLFRGSSDLFDYVSYRDKCVGVKNVICVIRSMDDNVFGGFTKMGWPKLEEDGGPTYNEDVDAILYTILRSKNAENAEVFKVKETEKKQYSVQHCGGFMCCFGDGGADLCLRNNCDVNMDESWDHYQHSNDAYSFDVKTRGYLNGGPDNVLFKVKEFEVYQCDV